MNNRDVVTVQKLFDTGRGSAGGGLLAGYNPVASSSSGIRARRAHGILMAVNFMLVGYRNLFCISVLCCHQSAGYIVI
jgi:hypothetical protein